MQLSLEDIIHKMKTGPMQDIESGKSELLSEIINKIDKPILKGLAQDVATVLTNWFEDPKIICCLIQGLWSIYATDKMKKRVRTIERMAERAVTRIKENSALKTGSGILSIAT